MSVWHPLDQHTLDPLMNGLPILSGAMAARRRRDDNEDDEIPERSYDDRYYRDGGGQNWWEAPVSIFHLLLTVGGMVTTVIVATFGFMRETQHDILILQERQAFVLKYIESDARQTEQRRDEYLEHLNQIRRDIESIRRELDLHRATDDSRFGRSPQQPEVRQQGPDRYLPRQSSRSGGGGP